MYLTSLKNFLTTYFQICKLVYEKRKIRIFCSLTLYVFSVISQMLSLVLVFYIAKAFLNNDIGVDFSILGQQHQITINNYYVLAAISLYGLSSLCLFLGEILWLGAIKIIVMEIATNINQRSDYADDMDLYLTSGAVSTFRILKILLKLVYPTLLSIGAFIVMLYINYKITVLVTIVMLIFAIVMTRIGRSVKRDFGDINSTDDDDDEEGVILEKNTDSLETLTKRIDSLALYFQHKVRSQFTSNIVLLPIIAIVLLALTNTSYTGESLLEFGFYLVLIKIMYTGVKSFSSSSVRLSKSYNLVSHFLHYSRKK